jgi:predicted transcriptional regulator
MVYNMRPKDFKIKQIQEQRSQAVLHGLADVKAEHVVDGDKVDAWLASWGTDHESDEP